MNKEKALIAHITEALHSALADLRDAADNCDDPALFKSKVQSLNLDGYTRALNEAQDYVTNYCTQVEGRVYLTDLDHIADVGKVFGLLEARSKLAKANEQYSSAITGVGLSKAIVDGLVAEHKLRMLGRNITLALESGAGFDLKNHSLRLSADRLGYYLHTPTSK